MLALKVEVSGTVHSPLVCLQGNRNMEATTEATTEVTTADTMAETTAATTVATTAVATTGVATHLTGENTPETETTMVKVWRRLERTAMSAKVLQCSPYQSTWVDYLCFQGTTITTLVRLTIREDTIREVMLQRTVPPKFRLASTRVAVPTIRSAIKAIFPMGCTVS